MDTLRTLLDVPDWKADANCRGVNPDVFFPVEDTRRTVGAAKVATAQAYCRRCDVQAECLAYALANGEREGIWGGLTESARRQLMKTRTRANEAKCGTISGCDKHRRNGEKPCDLCRQAYNVYNNERRRSRSRAGVA